MLTNQSSEVTLAENYEGLPPEIEKLSERLAKDPNSLVFSSLANAYRKHNMVDEAIEILQKGLQVHPDYASARIVLGKCYVDKRMYELAKEQFKNALESDPQNVVVLKNLANVYKTLNQYSEAYELFKRLLDLDPLNETFEREVEELKELARDISDSSGQYDTFQTIPGQTTETKEKEEPPAAQPEPGPEPAPETVTETEPEPDPETDAPTLSDIFTGAPDVPDEDAPQDTAQEIPSEPVEKPKIVTTAADFSDMFDQNETEETPPQSSAPVTEQPVQEEVTEEEPSEQTITTQEKREEESPPEATEQPPIVHGSPTMDMLQQEAPQQASFEKTVEKPEPVSETEPPQQVASPPEEASSSQTAKGESEDIGSITSAFDNAGLDTASESSIEEKEESLASDTEALVSELSDELSGDELAPAPPQQEIVQEADEMKPEMEPPAAEQPQEPAPTAEAPKPEQKPAATETLAEIYLNQGFNDKALEIYRELLAKNPDNETLKKKITALEQQMTEATPPPEPPPKETSDEGAENEPTEGDRRNQSKNLDSFQDWLKKFQK